MKAIYSIVGLHYRKAHQFVHRLPRGTPITLMREPGNAADQNAVQVWVRDRHVGYIKGEQARDLAPRMDKGPWHDVPMPATLVFENRYPAAEVDE